MPTTGGELRLLLLGHAGAGKTSLLAAFGRLIHSGDPLLGGRVSHPSKAFAEAASLLDDHGPGPTEEVGSYSLIYAPLQGENDDDDEPLQVLFIEAKGHDAAEVAAGQTSLRNPDELASAVRRADALLIAIDASTPAELLDYRASEFAGLLGGLEERRGRGTEVSALPVLVALTKCDLLGRPGDGAAAWLQTAEQRKQAVASRLRATLDREPQSPIRAFGSIEVHVLATAVKPPQFLDKGPQDRFHGVADLLERALALGSSYRLRRRHSRERLAWTVLGTFTALAAMLALAAVFVLYRAPVKNELAERVQSYRSEEGRTPAERLAEPLAPKIAQLQSFEADASFPALNPELTQFVDGRLHELKNYRDYLARLGRVSLTQVRRERELQQIAEQLQTDLAIPAPYQDEWSQTHAGQLHDQLVSDVRSLQEAVAATADWYRSLARQGEVLRTFPRDRPSGTASWQRWQKAVGDLFVKSAAVAFTGLKSDSTGVVFAMDSVVAARVNWESLRPKLERLRELVAALGLAGALPDGERQPLDIPAGFTAEQATNFKQRLEKLYPVLVKEASLAELPEAVEAEMLGTIRARYERLIEAGRAVVLRQFEQLEPEHHETVEGWQKVREWLGTPGTLADWRTLAVLLGRLLHLANPDPIAALADFLAKDQFDLHCQELTLTIPVKLRLIPSGSLTVHHKQGTESLPSLTFSSTTPTGSQEASRAPSNYRFIADGSSQLAYRPGELLWATLPVKRPDEDGDWLLTWSMCRSQLYQFERLLRSPRLHRSEQPNTEGKIAEGVLLSIIPPNGVPAAPDLLPVVKFTSR
jgi:energy-coupling factor transporter ATP-binding protein EcfA2